MLFRSAIPFCGMSPYRLNVGLKAITELLCAAIGGGFVINPGMVHRDMGDAWLDVCTVFDPELPGAGVHYDALISVNGVPVTAICSLLKQRSRDCKDAQDQTYLEPPVHRGNCTLATHGAGRVHRV